jgi:hypothetical protein
MKMSHVFSVFSALVAITFAAGACDDSSDGYQTWNSNNQTCDEFNTCDSCTNALGCGWCLQSDGSGTCGDDANDCSTEWTWESKYCRAPADASVSSSTNDAASSSETEDARSDADAASSSDADGE